MALSKNLNAAANKNIIVGDERELNKKAVIVFFTAIIAVAVIIGVNVLRSKKDSEKNMPKSNTTSISVKNEKETASKQEIPSVEQETTTEFSSTVDYTINGNEIILEVQGTPELNTADEKTAEQQPSAEEIVIE